MDGLPSRRLLLWLFLLLGSLVAPLVLVTTATLTRHSSEDSVAQHAQDILRLYVANLEGHLGKYAALPGLLAENPRVLAWLEPSALTAEKVAEGNAFLQKFSEISGVRESYLMRPDGETVVASNWDSPDSFVGHNFAFRPYFQAAMAGRPGRYFALGTTSGQRGFYFSWPVRKAGGEIVGVAVVKTNLEEMEQQWEDREDRILVTDPDGVVFISTIRDWLYHSLGNLDVARRKRIDQEMRYPGQTIRSIDISQQSSSARGHLFLTLPVEAASELEGTPRAASFMVQSQVMTQAGWTVHILTDSLLIQQKVSQNILLAILGLVIVGLLAFVFYQRLESWRARLAMEQTMAATLREARDLLEQRVEERTADLISSNDRLRLEMHEREQVQKKLHKAQDDLVQAGKLAAIGQLATEIAHEINQPLAAIRSYADNGVVFLERQRPEDAARNFARIAEVSERIATLSGQLKRFARRARGENGVVDVGSAIQMGLDLVSVSGRLRKVEIIYEDSHHPLFVVAERTRLEQVLINLFTNAADAMENSDEKKLVISTTLDDNFVTIVVSDSGPGITPEVMSHLFTPFYTTKEAGEGLGVGLSICHGIVDSFGGTLTAENGLEGGASFIVTLPRARTVPAPAG